MYRYSVTNRISGVTHGQFETLPEAIADAIRLQDDGKKAHIIDGQGSGAIVAGHFDVLEAEGYLGRSFGSETITHPVPVDEILELAKKTAPKKTIYHWE
jgi:hypothetical protein